MSDIISLGKYSIALFLAIVTIMIAKSLNFEELKTNLLILIVIMALICLTVDYYLEDSICEIKNSIDKVILTKNRIDKLVESSKKKLKKVMNALDDQKTRENLSKRFPRISSIINELSNEDQ